jgi:hypothetical protein
MSGHRREAIGVHTALEHTRHELARPPLDLGARAAAQHGADGGRFQRTVIDAAECEAREHRHHGAKAQRAPGMTAQETCEIREQGVVARKRAIEIEQGKRW